MLSLSRISKITVVFLAFIFCTSTYVVFGKFLFLPVFVISSLLIVALYLFASQNLKKANLFSSSILGFLLIICLIIIPNLVSLINLRFIPNKLIVQFLYLGIAIMTFTYFETLRKYKKFLLIAVYFNFIAGLASIVLPNVFQSFADVISDDILGYRGRAVGFFLQPNSLGMATINLYVFSIVLYQGGQIKRFLVPCFFTVLITGSRTSLSVFAVVVFIQAIGLFTNSTLIKTREGFKLMKRSLIMLSIAVIAIVSFLNSSLRNEQSFSNLVTRLEFYANATEKINELEKEGSMKDRLEYQAVFKQRIAEKPLFGYGFGVQNQDLQSGVLIGSAHNQYLEVIYQGGILYFIPFISIYLVLLGITLKFRNNNPYIFWGGLSFIVYLIFYGFFANTLFDLRNLYLTIGAFIYFSQEKSLLFK